ncbi:MAG: GtrA family protein [Lachnospiraceae bacterium]|nr:GtrA family protein [Lachnospiraceae bacterium]
MRTFFKYMISSLSSSLIDLVLFRIFCAIFDGNAWLFKTGLYVATATVLARIISAAYNFLINYTVVFRSDASRLGSLVRYALLAAGQMCMSALLVTVLHRIFGGEELFVKIPVDLFLFLVNFFVQRQFVYKK